MKDAEGRGAFNRVMIWRAEAFLEAQNAKPKNPYARLLSDVRKGNTGENPTVRVVGPLREYVGRV